ncbi:REP-associated tyrosine transposase [Thiorhodococcus minor]|uniref:Transposase n=1 Tax=Thiorhodococcus minor TaxID=57489 RepID=A0A6M0JXF1_9GAMM|nr:transposase [Thiorhodococcus minor]NEV62226.1 transposase [Thiorhodococcus minor]
MTDYRRLYIPGATYFFTLVSESRQPLLASDDAVGRLREAFRYAMRRRPFRFDAVVILPDHLHAIWTLPLDDADFSERWRLIKYRFSHRSAERGTTRPSLSSKREKGLWQRRFWEHCIRDEADFAGHFHYLHFNPVKHGLTKRVADWPHSSFHRFVELGVYTPDWGCAIDTFDIAGDGGE